jgi:hypothetical protein
MRETRASVVKAKTLNGPICPEILLIDENLTPAGKIVWLAIRNREGRNGNAWPSMDTIAADTGLGRRTVVRATEKLEELGWLKVKKETGGSNLYECWIPVDKSSTTSAKMAHHQCQNGTSAKMAPKPIQIIEGIKEPIKEPMHSADKLSAGKSGDERLTSIRETLDAVRKRLEMDKVILGRRVLSEDDRRSLCRKS